MREQVIVLAIFNNFNKSESFLSGEMKRISRDGTLKGHIRSLASHLLPALLPF